MADFDPDRFQTERPSGTPMMTVRPRKLDRDDAERLVRKYNPDITKAAVAGEVDNIMRESGGDPTNRTGDSGTSAGMYQHHLGRLDGLKSFAKEHGKDWTDPEVQVQYSRLEKERDYPGLLRLQQSTNDRGVAEDAFKRIFERPASIMWQNGPNGQPILGDYSDYAMREHQNRPGTDIMMMTPWEYLDLAPPLEGKPFESPAGRSLMRSVNKGEPIESLPTLDIAVDGPSATVTDQDGRHRALLAQQQGQQAMPVAVRRTGEGSPKEITGMTGNLQAFDYPKMGATERPEVGPEQPKEPLSLMEEIGEALIPSAHAEDADPFAKYVPQAQGEAQGTGGDPSDPFAKYAPSQQPQQPGDSALMSFLKGASEGAGEPIYAGQELIGKGIEAAGAPQTGQALTADARARMAGEQQKIAADQIAHPTATGAGKFAGDLGMQLAIAAAAARGLGPVGGALAGGALSGALTPTEDEGFWKQKLVDTLLGAGTAGATAKAGQMIGRALTPTFRAALDKLLGEGVEMTPGQIAGGKLKTAEDKLASMPFLGDQIKDAVRRSFQSFNRAAINRGLKEIGTQLPKDLGHGRDAIGFAEDRFSDAYNAVIPNMQGTIDSGMKRDLLDVLNKAANIRIPDRYQDELHNVLLSEVVNPIRQAGGTINGKEAQMIGTKLDRIIKSWRNSEDTYRNNLAPLLREADAALDSMMARQNPILQAAKDKIDKGYAQFKVVQKATNYATGGDGSGLFSPYQLGRAAKFSNNSKDDRLYARGGALLQDLANAGQEVLPSGVPNSGTSDRAAMMALFTRPGLAIPFLGASWTAGKAYSPPVSAALNAGLRMLGQQPGPTRQALSNIVTGAGRALAPAAGSEAARMATPIPQ